MKKIFMGYHEFITFFYIFFVTSYMKSKLGFQTTRFSYAFCLSIIHLLDDFFVDFNDYSQKGIMIQSNYF